MAWLTVREAAERLESSEAAVRKKMQRGTLPRRKGSDGRVYVYLPFNQDIEKDVGARESKDSGQGQFGSWLEYVAAGAGAIAVVAGLTYVLGLLALWVAMLRTYTHDPSSAWYAVSLLPQTVVAGRGFAQLVALPVATILIIGLFLALVDLKNLWSFRNVFALFISTILISWRATAYYCWSGLEFIWNLSVPGVQLKVVWILFIGVAVISLDKWRRSHNVDEGSHRSDTTEPVDDSTRVPTLRAAWARVKEHPWVWAIAVTVPLYIWIVGENLLESRPELPTVEITSVEDTQEAGVQYRKGALLTHGDGFWYIFDTEGTHKGDLTALPDDTVKAIRLIGTKGCPDPPPISVPPPIWKKN